MSQKVTNRAAQSHAKNPLETNLEKTVVTIPHWGAEPERKSEAERSEKARLQSLHANKERLKAPAGCGDTETRIN